MPQFADDLQAAVDALGIDQPGVLLGIALANWQSAEERDGFLNTLTSR